MLQYIFVHTHSQKTNQLEEVIDNQKQEIEFLKEQVNKLTSTGLPEGQAERSGGDLLSLPSGVSDSGPLKRQLIKMEHAMKVRVCVCVCVYMRSIN